MREIVKFEIAYHCNSFNPSRYVATATINGVKFYNDGSSWQEARKGLVRTVEDYLLSRGTVPQPEIIEIVIDTNQQPTKGN